ncbi:MAG: hypothetical protein LBS33_03960, partial [Streptococcaceae bacterium]|nr:hypothetical protein [Streptococcaceae bacterium]
KKETPTTLANPVISTHAGTLADPIPFGETAEITEKYQDNTAQMQECKLRLSLISVVRGEAAWKIITKASKENEQAPAGYEWALAKGKIGVTDLAKDVAYQVANSSIPVDTTGVVITQRTADSIVIPKPELTGSVQNNQSISGYFAFVVKTGEDFLLEYQTTNAQAYFLVK